LIGSLIIYLAKVDFTVSGMLVGPTLDGSKRLCLYLLWIWVPSTLQLPCGIGSLLARNRLGYLGALGKIGRLPRLAGFVCRIQVGKPKISNVGCSGAKSKMDGKRP
jgi:hypothetical protein